MLKTLWLLFVASTAAWTGCSTSDQAGDDSPAPVDSQDHDAVPEQKPAQGSATDTQGDLPPPDGDPAEAGGVKCPRYPMVFHHGFMGGAKIGGFNGVEAHFKKAGCKVYVTEVAAVQSSEYRAGQLKTRVDQILAESGAPKVHLIAHSQGGLDGRWMISKLGMGEKVASLSMLGTPNHGTQLADLSLKNSGPLARQALTSMMNFMGKTVNGSTPDPDTIAAVESLTIEYVEGTFNREAQDVPGVLYQSWAGITGSGSGDKTKTLLLLSAGALTLTEGQNDGVVSVKSAQWGSYRGSVPADHMDLIGYQVMDGPTAFDHLKFLSDLANEFAGKGL